MRIKEFKNKTRKFTDLDNMFNIYKDKRNNFVFNLNSTIYLNVSTDNLKKYTVDHDIHWPLISYKLYKTTRLFWVLMKLNGIDAKNAFDVIPAGTTVYYLDNSYVTRIIDQLES